MTRFWLLRSVAVNFCLTNAAGDGAGAGTHVCAAVRSLGFLARTVCSFSWYLLTPRNVRCSLTGDTTIGMLASSFLRTATRPGRLCRLLFGVENCGHQHDVCKTSIQMPASSSNLRFRDTLLHLKGVPTVRGVCQHLALTSSAVFPGAAPQPS